MFQKLLEFEKDLLITKGSSTRQKRVSNTERQSIANSWMVQIDMIRNPVGASFSADVQQDFTCERQQNGKRHRSDLHFSDSPVPWLPSL